MEKQSKILEKKIYNFIKFKKFTDFNKFYKNFENLQMLTNFTKFIKILKFLYKIKIIYFRSENIFNSENCNLHFVSNFLFKASRHSIKSS